MRQSIGAVSTFNIVIIFIVIVFGLLIGAINYYKAFKLNSRILNTIEKYEGYNELAFSEIGGFLDTMGYIRGNSGCDPQNHGANLVSNQNGNHEVDNRYDYCVYYHNEDGTSNDPNGNGTYYNYSVITYIYVDLPFMNQLKIPVYTKGERTYKYSESNNPMAS